MSEQCPDILRCDPQNLRQAMSIHTRKITDACRDKDCVEDLRFYPTASAMELLSGCQMVRGGTAELLYVYTDVEPVTFNRGFYSIDMRFFYRVTLQVGTGTPRCAGAEGLCVFDKRCILFGSEGSAKIFSSDTVIDELEPFGDARSQLRHDDLVDEATEKLDDAQRELDDAKAEADDKLGDAQKELSDARRKLDDGWKDYYDGQQELKDARVELDDAKIELDDGEMQYLNGMEEYENALDEYEKGRAEYEDGLAQYEDGVKELESGEKELAAGRRQLESGERQLNSLAKTVTDALAGTGSPYAGAPEKLLEDLGRGDSAAIAATDGALGGMRAQLTGGIAQAQSKIDEMQDQLVTVNTAIDQLADSTRIHDAGAEADAC